MMLPRRYLPPIPALMALEAVDRLGTASAAAEELSLTQGAISRALQGLEAQLGVALILRERQRLRLTPAGRDYVAEVRKALNLLASASLTLRANPTGGALNLAILPAFGMHWLAPRLARFAQSHPEVTINLSTRLKPFDFTGTAFDAAIHYGRLDGGRQDWPDVDSLKLMDEEVLAVAAPGVPALGAATDILHHPLLQLESRTGDWGRWLAHHGHPGLRPPGMLFDQFATLTQGAIHGMGLALIPTFLIQRELSEGRLIPVFGPPIRALGSYYLVWPDTIPDRAPLRSLRLWLQSDAADPALTPTDPPATLA
ncbi:LysR substrate-binding domain-containing protein [Tabrizicola sp.]|uniref:LysR substrate-binding domain-containing protein n=1 Tax=Tabrizicola sp. TaxID=2005166 RepID=UPI0025CE54ED|nr:LysR substrate-binding domain-containing protein [Tabrizicola sp.]